MRSAGAFRRRPSPSKGEFDFTRRIYENPAMFNALKRQFFAGLIVFVPLALTVYLIRLFFLTTSQTFYPLIAHQHFFHLPAAAVRPISFLSIVFVIWFL